MLCFYYSITPYFAQIPACDIIRAVEINVTIEEGIVSCLKVGWVQDIAGQVLASCGVCPDLELGLVISGQEQMRQLNRHYLGRDRTTDVIAFPLLPKQSEGEFFIQPPDGLLHLGEIIISYPQAEVQARDQGHSLEKEIIILIIHGILHLLGYDDEKPELKREMRTREQEILNQVEGGES